MVAAIMLHGPLARAADELLWREVAPENLVFMELQEGRVTIELNPRFAPNTFSDSA